MIEEVSFSCVGCLEFEVLNILLPRIEDDSYDFLG